MGMFDYLEIRCEIDGLPAYVPGKKLELRELQQTKSLDCLLDHYVLGEDKQLYIKEFNYEDGTYSEENPVDYTGEINFRHNYKDESGINQVTPYTLLIYDGRLLAVKKYPTRAYT